MPSIAYRIQSSKVLEFLRNVNSPLKCQKFCLQRRLCKHFVWSGLVNNNNKFSNVCWLLESADESRICTSCVSGDVQCAKERSVKGNTMATKFRKTTLSATKEQNWAEKRETREQKTYKNCPVALRNKVRFHLECTFATFWTCIPCQ